MANGLVEYRIQTETGSRSVSREEFIELGGIEGGSVIEAPSRDPVVDAIREEVAKSQAFFAELAASIRAPHVGADYKAFVKDLLLRAQERNLYEPTAD
jgi:hypothetical protein